MTGKHRRMPVGQSHALKTWLIKRAGKRCEGCGYRFRGHEQQLAREHGAMELDHKIPLERNGNDNPANLQVLCLPCHDGKTNGEGYSGSIRNMTDAEWRQAGKPQDWRRKNQLTARRARRRRS